MAYIDKFIAADNLMPQLLTINTSTTDPVIQSSFAGFFSVSAITVFELAIKDIFISFAERKHKVFKAFIESHFKKINGMIGVPDLRGKHIKSFGSKYVDKFDKNLQIQEDTILRADKISIISVYNNILLCRHKFVHAGSPTLTLPEAITSYVYAKEVIHCLNKTMQR